MKKEDRVPLLKVAWSKMPERARDLIKIEEGSMTVTFRFQANRIAAIDMLEFMKLVYEEVANDINVRRSPDLDKHKMTVLKLQEAIHWQADVYKDMAQILQTIRQDKGGSDE